jgi:hypothetical protein
VFFLADQTFAYATHNIRLLLLLLLQTACRGKWNSATKRHFFIFNLMK